MDLILLYSFFSSFDFRVRPEEEEEKEKGGGLIEKEIGLKRIQRKTVGDTQNKSVDLNMKGKEREGEEEVEEENNLGRPFGLKHPEMESDSSQIKEGSGSCRCDN